jgi:hypothetical protein
MLNLFSVAKTRGLTANNHVHDRDQIHDEGRQRTLGEQDPSGVGSTTTGSRHVHMMAQSGKLGRNSVDNMRLAPSAAVPEHVSTFPKGREQGTRRGREGCFFLQHTCRWCDNHPSRRNFGCAREAAAATAILGPILGQKIPLCQARSRSGVRVLRQAPGHAADAG